MVKQITLYNEPPRGKTNNVVSEQVRHKSGCTVTEEGWKLEIGFKKKRKCTVCVVKTKALISFAVTAKLICVFVFAYADCCFPMWRLKSHYTICC